MNYRGDWSKATKFRDRCEIQMCIMTSSALDCDQKVEAYLDIKKCWDKLDKLRE